MTVIQIDHANGDPADWRVLYPFESHELRLGEHRYHYVDEGNGDVLLFVHGNPTWSFYWRNLILVLRSQYRAVAVDHIGCGLSDKPAAYPYCLTKHVENLTHLVRALDLRGITLVAHDWGGAIGLGAALNEPDRFDRFILCNTAAFCGGRMPWRIRVCRMPLAGTLAVRGLNAFARAALHMAVCHRERMTPAVRAGLLAPYNSWNHRVAISRFVEDIPMSRRHPSYAILSRIEEGLPRFATRPWQFLWGMRDWCFTPWFLERFESIFPNAVVHRFADAGHYVVEDAHERMIPLMRQFLSTHPFRETPRRTLHD